MSSPDIAAVKTFLLDLQDRICAMLEAEEDGVKFLTDEWTRAEGGGGRSRVMENGRIVEREADLIAAALSLRLSRPSSLPDDPGSN